MRKAKKAPEKPMKNAYIICGEVEFEKAVCDEYAKIYHLNVIQRAYPTNEEEKWEAVNDIITKAEEGKIDTVLMYEAESLSKIREASSKAIEKMVKAGLQFRMVYYCLYNLFGKNYEGHN